MTLPLCQRSDLPRVLCDCCDSFTMTDAERAYLAGQGLLRYTPPPAPQPVRVVPLPDYMGGGWVQPAETKIVDSAQPCHVKGCTRAAGDAFVCPQCLDRLEVALGDIPGLLEDLLIMTTRQHKFRAPAVSRAAKTGTRWDAMLTAHESAELVNEGFTRAPYVSQAGDATRTLVAAVLSAYQVLGGTETPLDPATASRRLLSAIGKVPGSSLAPSIIETVTKAHATAMRVIDRPDDAIYIGTCPDCKTPMHANPDNDTHTCTTCGNTHALAERQQAIRDRLTDAQLTLRQIADLSGPTLGVRITLGQLKNWANRDGKLAPATTDREGVKLYRVGDALDLLKLPTSMC
jgi:hypothetical protein